MIDTRRLWSRAALAGLVLLGACGDFDVANENAPTTDQLEGNPTRAILARAATGIFTGVTGLLGDNGAATSSSTASTAANSTTWPATTRARPARNCGVPRIPAAVAAPDGPTCTPTSGASTSTPRGNQLDGAVGGGEARRARVCQDDQGAGHFHRLIVRTGPLGIPMDVDRAISDEPAPFVSQTDAYAAIVALLDEAKADLLAGGGISPSPSRPGGPASPPRPISSGSIAACWRRYRSTAPCSNGCGGPCFTGGTHRAQRIVHHDGEPAALPGHGRLHCLRPGSG